MKSRNAIVLGLVAVTALATVNAQDITSVLDNNRRMSDVSVSCLSAGVQKQGSQFQGSLLPSALGRIDYSDACMVNASNNRNSGNLFSENKQQSNPFPQQIALMPTYVNDSELLGERTPMQATVTGGTAEFARLTLVEEGRNKPAKTQVQASVTR